MRLAVFTPLPPAPTGIADYSQALLPHLAAHARVDVFVDDGYEPHGFGSAHPIRIRNKAEYRPEEFDETLFQFGNNHFHVYVYDQALKTRGILLMHEYNMHYLVADATITRTGWDDYLREVEYEGGDQALAHARRAQLGEVGLDHHQLPMNRRILESGKAAIVHSNFMSRRLDEAETDVPILQIPHGAWIPRVQREKYRAELGISDDTPLIGVFGFLKPYKRVREALLAMQWVVRSHRQARMILVGEEHPELPVQRMIEELGLGHHVRVLGYAPIEEFVEYIGACDICLNLRYPTVGETSGTLLRALGLGKAVIVSDIGSFADLPDSICLKAPVDNSEVDFIVEYINLLIERPEIRAVIGERAREYVARECSWDRVGKLFADRIRDIHSGLPPPAAAAQQTAVKPPVNGAAMMAKTAPDSWFSADGTDLAAHILSFCHDEAAVGYVKTHLTRLTRTLKITPPGGPEDAVLEMGSYLHITPALKSVLGYGTVRGCYLGPSGQTDRRTTTSSTGESFECDIDLFDAEKDPYPYQDGSFATVLCCELLEHLYEDPMHLMSEVNRILTVGGHVVLTTPNICSLRAAGAALLGYHPGLFHQYIAPDASGNVDPRHAREYAPRDLQELMEAAGFEVVRMETGPYGEENAGDHAWVANLLERFDLPNELRDDCLYVVGRKIGPIRSRYPIALYAHG